MARPTSIRFPDPLRARIERVEGGSFHAKVLSLVERGLADGEGPRSPDPSEARRTRPAAPPVVVPPFRRDARPYPKPSARK